MEIKLFGTFWEDIWGKNNKDTTIPPLKISDGNFAFTEEEKASAFNNYFRSISSINDENITLPHFELRTDSSLEIITISESEIVDILSNLKVNKACGPDGISHRMLKHTCKTISKPLCTLFNSSLQFTTYPSLWKSANVIPIF